MSGKGASVAVLAVPPRQCISTYPLLRPLLAYQPDLPTLDNTHIARLLTDQYGRRLERRLPAGLGRLANKSWDVAK